MGRLRRPGRSTAAEQPARRRRPGPRRRAAADGPPRRPRQVLVQEADGPVEHPVNVGAAALTLAELRVASKPGARKAGRKRKAEAAEGDERDDAPAEDEGACF